MNRKREVYTTEKIDNVMTALKSMPPIERKRKSHSKQEAVTMLSKEILQMRKRGYEWDDIAEALKGEGIVISPPTLKNYLQRAKKPSTSKPAPKPLQEQNSTPPLTKSARITPNPDSEDI